MRAGRPRGMFSQPRKPESTSPGRSTRGAQSSPGSAWRSAWRRGQRSIGPPPCRRRRTTRGRRQAPSTSSRAPSPRQPVAAGRPRCLRGAPTAKGQGPPAGERAGSCRQVGTDRGDRASRRCRPGTAWARPRRGGGERVEPSLVEVPRLEVRGRGTDDEPIRRESARYAPRRCAVEPGVTGPADRLDPRRIDRGASRRGPTCRAAARTTRPGGSTAAPRRQLRPADRDQAPAG